MVKKILVVCNYYAPENTIAAVRISKLVKYFCKEKYEVDVITEKKEINFIDDSLKADMENVNVSYLSNSWFCRKVCKIYKTITDSSRKKRMSIMDNRERINPKSGHVEFYPFETAYPLFGSIDYLINQYRQRDLARNILKITSNKKYDCFITSYGDSLAYFCGKKYKKKHEEIPWIFDIRDAIYRYKFTPDYIKFIPVKYERYVCQHADAIVGVSKGICNRFALKCQSKVFCITNGYDKDSYFEDLYEKDTVRLYQDKMTFTYTGSMYGGLQNLSLFFEAIKKLIDEDVIKSEHVAFVYAGNESAFDVFRRQAMKFGLENLCIYFGKLVRKEAIELQSKSDVLLMASYDYKDNNGGIITGKLFEYMAAGKPVIATITGDIVNSEVKQIITKTKIGICCEESGGDDDKERLSKYILLQYRHFINKESLEYNPFADEIRKYEYKNIAKEYIKLIKSMERTGK